MYFRSKALYIALVHFPGVKSNFTRLLRKLRIDNEKASNGMRIIGRKTKNCKVLKTFQITCIESALMNLIYKKLQT